MPTKVHLVKAMFFPVAMYGYESWTIKKAECWRMDAFELWCWKRLLKVPFTARRSNQSILKEANHEYSLGGLLLKFQYFGHLMWRANSLEKTLMLGRLRAGEEVGDRGWDGWMASSTQWTQDWANSRRQWRTGNPGVLQSMGVTKSRTWLSNWTTKTAFTACKKTDDYWDEFHLFCDTIQVYHFHNISKYSWSTGPARKIMCSDT